MVWMATDWDKAATVSSTRQTILTNITAPRLTGLSWCLSPPTWRGGGHMNRTTKRRTKSSVRTWFPYPVVQELTTNFSHCSWRPVVLQASLCALNQGRGHPGLCSYKFTHQAVARDLNRLDCLLEEVKMETSLTEAEDRVCSMWTQYKVVLRRSGMADLVTKSLTYAFYILCIASSLLI